MRPPIDEIAARKSRVQVRRPRGRRRLTPSSLTIVLSILTVTATFLFILTPAASASPLIVGGDYVTFFCPEGTITVGGIQVCNMGHQTSIMCYDSPSCQATMSATMAPGHSFTSWGTQGDASVSSHTLQTTTLTTTDPNGYHETGYVWLCPYGTVTFTSHVTYTATNATIYFTPNTSSGCTASVSVTLVWGNTTSYGFTAFQNQPYNTGQQYSTYLDFLQPNSTYYYELTGTSSGFSGGSTTGSWQTISDGPYMGSSGSYILGTVYGPKGPPTHAPAGILVVATCLTPFVLQPFTYDNPWFAYTTTNSAGNYAIYVPGYYETYPPYNRVDICQAQQAGGGVAEGYIVCLVNAAVLNSAPSTCLPPSDDSLPAGGTWDDYWNETIVTWAPQVVNFQLPLNFERYNVVQIQDYSNANFANGYPNSTINYTSGSTYTTSSSHCWTALFVFSGCSKASNTIATSGTFTATGHNLVVTQDLELTGTLLFDSLSRTSYIAAEDYYEQDAPPVNEPAIWPSGDNITMADAASNSSIYPIWSWGAGFHDQAREVYSTAPVGYSVTVSSQSQTSGIVKGFEVGLDFSLKGVGVSIALATDQWSQMSTYTATDTLSWSVIGNSQTVPICYAVYGVGGSSSSSGSTADAIGIWAFAPTYSGGQYNCTATQ